MVIEVPGPDGRRQAESLRSSLAEALKEGAKVSNPVETGELRLRGIDPSLGLDEIRSSLVGIGMCLAEELTLISVGRMRDGMGIVWARCPLDAAVRIAEWGSVGIGWTRVRVDLIRKKPVQCYKCWRFGHVRASCRNEEDHAGAYFRCGLTGHAAGSCGSAPCCVVCRDLKRSFDHRMGSFKCLENQGFNVGVHRFRRPPPPFLVRGTEEGVRYRQ